MEFVHEIVSDIIIDELNKCDNEISSSSTESEEENLILGDKNKKSRISDYVTKIIPTYSDPTFREHFRLNRCGVEKIMHAVGSEWHSSSTGRSPLDLRTAVLLTLWNMANQETYRGLADRFGISIAAAHKNFLNICKIMYKKRCEYIKWPTDNADTVVNKFNQLRSHSFPNVIGCIDGTHIQISGPIKDNSFYNRKGHHSIIIQAVCDSDLRFIDICTGWPGSVHDARVWKSSSLYKKLKNDAHFIKKEYHLLGDQAYPLDIFLMKPFKDNGHLSPKQKHFNLVLSSTRIVIEQAFGRLKGIFRKLKYIQCYNLSNLKEITITACILHNLVIDEKVTTEDIYYLDHRFSTLFCPPPTSRNFFF